MDIEKVIENLRYSVENSERHVQAVRNADTDHPFPVIPLPLPEARALLTEIGYWRARCGKAEKAIYWSDNSDLAEETNKDWQDAVSNEVRKAAYLKEINAPVEPFTYPLGDTVNVPLAAS